MRARGWATDVEELVEGEVSLAAPIDDRRGVTVGAIGISGPIERLCRQRGAAQRHDLIRARGGPGGLPRPGRDPVVRSL